MKRLIGLCVMVALIAGACGPKLPVLHLYNWSDYMKPEVIARFEKQYNCRVVQDFYDSNEAMYAKLKAGARGYDIVVPTAYMVSIMHKQGMLQSLDKALLPNISWIDTAFLKFTGDQAMEHSVPYMVGGSGIGYLKSRVSEIDSTWGMFGNAALAGRMTMLDDSRATIGAALKYLGYSLNTVVDSQLVAARDVVIGWKKNLAKFEADQYKPGLISAEFLLVHGYTGDLMQTMVENSDIGMFIPREGSLIASDNMAILKGAPQPELAHKFINFLLDPKVAAENMEHIYYLAPNKGAREYLSEKFLANAAIMVSADAYANCEVIEDLGEATVKYNKIWDEIKAAR